MRLLKIIAAEVMIDGGGFQALEWNSLSEDIRFEFSGDEDHG